MAVRSLEADGIVVHYANEIDANAQEIKTWSWLAEAVFPREAYVRVFEFDLGGVNSVTEHQLSLMLRFKDIQKINLESTDVGDSQVARLTGFPKLNAINLRNTRVANKCLYNLSRIPTLYRVDLAETQVTEDAKAEFTRQFPQCQIVDLTGVWIKR